MRIVWDRTCLAVRGLELREVKKEVNAQARTRLDRMWDLTFPVTWADMLGGATLNVRHLRESLALGEPSHLARALAQEAAFRAMQNPSEAGSAMLFDRARALLNLNREPRLETFIDFIEGSAAQFRWDFATSRTLLERAEKTCDQHLPDEPWLLTNTRMGLGSVLFSVGEHAMFAAKSETWIEDARSRGDRFAVAALEGLGQGFERHLIQDEPDLARKRLNDAMAPWGRDRFSLPHLGEMFGAVNIELYRGGSGAWQWLEEERARLEQAFLIRSTFGRASLAVLCALAGLAHCVEASPADRKQRIAATDRWASRTGRMAVPIAHTLGPLLKAQSLALSGMTGEALVTTRVACRLLEGGGLFHQHAARYFEGVLEGGDAGRGKRVAAIAFFAEQGWKNPQRAIAMWVPAIDFLARS